jgi:fructose-1,6-bisphosphatase I
MVNALLNCYACAALVSEENEEAIIVPADRRGKYIVAFDPLDGSSNIDCNVSTGTIFAVYERVTPAGTEPGNADVLRPGTDVIAAGYCMYGSATDFVLTFRDGACRARRRRRRRRARAHPPNSP